jgi:hypothetical protein
MDSYIPPAFPLYEFVPKESADGTDRRRLAHWDGLVGAPAADVLLAWERGPASVLVRTTDRVFEGTYARVVAAHLALGGTLLPTVLRPVGPKRIVREIERFRDDDDLWSPIPDLVPGATRAEAAAADGYSIAYTQFDEGAVFVAAVGVPLEDFRVRITRG